MRWRIALFLLLLPLVAAGAALLWLRGSLPQTYGALHVTGLGAEVRILRDKDGVPHINAASDRDAAFALGFVHAQDRLFQMDMMRRLGAGRLSEVLGEATLNLDKTMRTLGLYRLAEAELADLSPPLRDALDAYAAGVNAFLDQHRTLPLEYHLLRTTPERWRPADSLVWGKHMALMLAGNYRSELLRARIAAKLKPAQLAPAQLAQLYPDYPAEALVTLSELVDLYRALPLDRIRAALPDVVGPTFASNNWVVDGAHSVTGKPLLANDPHLGLATPGVWYLARIDTPDLHLAGATAPGVPFLVIGHNDRIGWGFTTTQGDVEDVFIERVDPQNPDRYMTPDGPQPFQLRQEQIAVRDAPSVTLTIRSTRHGPVISDIGLGGGAAPGGHVLALRATFLDPGDRTPQAFWDLNRARNWSEFNMALESFAAPQQNIVYADIDGNIGFVAPARIPIRASGNGWLPVEGWTDEHEWTGYIPFADLPRAYNPSRGRFVSANNKIVPDSYPYFIGRDWDVPNRAERIDTLLIQTPQQSLDASAAIQRDTLSPMAQKLLPLMLKMKPANPRAAAALDLLRRWDGRMEEGEAAPLVFMAWLRDFERALFADRLGDAFPDYWDQPRPLVVEGILKEYTEWCSDPAAPNRDSCAARLADSLDRALEDLVVAHGGDMTRWRWGADHVATFAHPVLSRVAVLRDLFAVEIPAPGGYDTLNRGGMAIANPDHPYRDVHGAGLRMLLDFADLDRSRFMIVPGQSGNPLSPHYADLLHPWHDFAWLTLPRDGEGSVLLLEPR